MPNVGTITGSMVLDPSAYISGLGQAAAATRSYQAGINGVTFAGFNRGVFATTTLLYGLNRIMHSMSKGMEEYSNVLGRIGSVADLTAASVGALADSMKRLSVEQGVGRKDIMGGMYTALQSRFASPAEMRAMAQGGAILSRSSGKEINVKKSVDLLSVARQALGINMDAVTSGRMNNLLLKGRDVGRWELDQMAAALGIPLTVYGNQFAGRIGGEETLRQLVAIMSTATLAGMNPRMTATGTRRLVERTVQLNKTKAGDPLRRGLIDLGFDPQDPIMSALNQGPIKFLNTLIRLTGGQTSELNRLGFGSRDLMLLTSAMRGNGGLLNKTYEELSYANTAGTAERYGEKMKGTYDYTRDRLRSQWELTSQSFMQASIPFIGQFTSMLETFNTVAQKLPDSVKSFMMLTSALMTFRMFMNLLGLRGPLFHQAAGGAMMPGMPQSPANNATVSFLPPKPFSVPLPISGKNADMGINRVNATTRMPFSWVTGKSSPRGFNLIFPQTGVDVGRNPRNFGTPATGAALNAITLSTIRRATAAKIAAGSGIGETYGMPVVPKGFGLLPGRSFTSHFAGMGGTAGSAVGMLGGMALGRSMEGENGSGMLPIMLSMLGAQFGGNLTTALSAQYGGMLPAAGALFSKFGLPAMAVTGAFKMFGGMGKQMPGSPGAKIALDREALLRPRGGNAFVRHISNLWNSLPAIGVMAGEALYGTQGKKRGPFADTFGRSRKGWLTSGMGSDALARVWDDPTRGDLYKRLVAPSLSDSSRSVFKRAGIKGLGDLLGNSKFRDMHISQFGEGSWRGLVSGDMYQKNPSGWVDVMTDSIRLFTNQMEKAKVATDLATEMERELAGARAALYEEVRPVIGYLSGYKTLFGLEGSQMDPYQLPKSKKWLEKYGYATNAFEQKFMSPYFANPKAGLEGKDLTPFFGESKLADMRAGYEESIGKSADSPYKEAEGLNRKLKSMQFLAKWGPYLSDPTKVTDEMLRSGLDLDTASMNPAMRRSVFESLRGLDYTAWTKTFEPQSAPFSNALYYGSKEGYNATLERPKEDFQVKILTEKLGQVADSIDAMVSKNDERERSFKDSLIEIIKTATTPIVDAVAGISSDFNGAEGFPSISE